MAYPEYDYRLDDYREGNTKSVGIFSSLIFSPQEGQRFLISVWVNWFETLGQEQVWSEDYARQIDF